MGWVDPRVGLGWAGLCWVEIFRLDWFVGLNFYPLVMGWVGLGWVSRLVG